MANRVILGKSTNSNLGHSGGKFGLYISRAGDDITNCTKDQLIFNTDNVGFNSGAVDVGSSSSTGNELISRFLNGGFSGATSATVTNGGNTAITVTVSIVKGFSTQSLY